MFERKFVHILLLTMLIIGTSLGVVYITTRSGPFEVSAQVVEFDNGMVILKNGNISIVFPKGWSGYGNYSLCDDGPEGEYRVAVSEGFVRIDYLWEGGREVLFIHPQHYQVEKSGEEVSLVFSGETNTWTYNLRFSLKDNASMVDFSYVLSPNKDVGVLGVYGPTLHIGEGTFGGDKVDALFPGLEWLVDNEQSSNTLDIHGPGHLRLVPAWYEITVPAMAVSTGDHMVGLIWDAMQKWGGVHVCPSAIFSSPNWYQGQNNHLVGLFLPSTRGGWVTKGEYWASKPYQLGAGKKIRLEASLVARSGEGSLGIIDAWIERFGVPELQDLPRSIQEEVELCREGLMDTLWSEEKKGWRPSFEKEPRNIPEFATYLWVDSLLTNDPAVKERLRDRVWEVIDQTGPGAIANAWHFDLPFYVGYLNEALQRARVGVMGIEKTQGESGEWVFSPGEGMEELGNPGETASGLIATPAEILLRWARISGDEEALKKGLKALEYMEEHHLDVPRAAQIWEVPVHTPDILASAKACEAYLEAYIITGEEHYLERARYWARTGLPFVFFWSTEDRKVMKGADISVFGASWYVSPGWFGKPVQWCGLAYAYSLVQLAEYDNSFPWEQIAELIVRSAMWQQVDEGPMKGTYPDAWDLATNTPIPVHINPTLIMKNLFALMGVDPGVSTVVLEVEEGERLHLTSAARIVDASLSNKTLTFDLKFHGGETCYTLIAKIKKPEAVYKGWEKLEEFQNLNDVSEGWSYFDWGGYVVVKTRFDENGIVNSKVEGVIPC